MIPKRVVIVTAEPRGAYHLEPLYPAMRCSRIAFTHLVPYPEPLQGTAWDMISTSPDTLAAADLLVVTGGGFTAWTELVALRAQELDLPFVVSELAYGARPDGQPHPLPVGLSALGEFGADLFSAYYRVEPQRVVITGTPLLDTLPPWQPVAGQILLLSTSDSENRDPYSELRRLGDRLRSEGYSVRVRLHPRENAAPWKGFEIDRSPTAALAAAQSAAVIGYPGSAHPICAALGVPLAALAPSDELAEALPASHRVVVPTWVRSADEIAIDELVPAEPAAVHLLCGPVGGASERVVDFWRSHL